MDRDIAQQLITKLTSIASDIASIKASQATIAGGSNDNRSASLNLSREEIPVETIDEIPAETPAVAKTKRNSKNA